MKALIVAPEPFFTPRGTPYSVYYRTEVSSELGVKVDLLTYGEGQDVDIPNVKIIRTPRFNFLGKVKVGPSFLKLFYDLFLIAGMLFLLFSNEYDFVHAHEEAVFFAFLLKPFFRFKLIYDMHSSLPEQLTNFKFSSSKFLRWIFKKLEDACLKSSDAIITICPHLYNYVNTIIIDIKKNFLIENSIFEPIKLNNPSAMEIDTHQIEHNENLLKKDLVVYCGTLEKYQGIDILLKGFKFTVSKNPNAFLIIVGGTKEQVNLYKTLAEESGIKDNVLFTGRVPQNVSKYYTKIAKVLVSPRTSGTNTPLKVYEQLESGIPLVATDIYSHTQVLTSDVCFLVDAQPESFGNGILDALYGKDEAAKKVEAAKKMYEEKYSRSVYTQKLKNLFELIK